ncbi:hypothetical protein EYF80_010356 [Liparis tanakae]|uniref:Uncharacterized protein n=1 Tax=Liparis tanakae TaxID=230148 RepID=A0A4Z2IQ48_9TELE|nr:hypothetical protein EYF80_010356 [Liparis tanakae]
MSIKANGLFLLCNNSSIALPVPARVRVASEGTDGGASAHRAPPPSHSGDRPSLPRGAEPRTPGCGCFD